MDWKIEVIPIPVADVEKAKRFYAEQMGFTVDLDLRLGDGSRVVQLTPPGSGCSIQIGSQTGAAPGSVRAVQIVVDDIGSAREELAARGVEVSEVKHYDEDGTLAEGPGGRWNSFVFFSDLDGNTWVLQERG